MASGEIHVVAGILIKKDFVLAAQRKASGSLPLKWEFPGGKAEPGETHEQCLEREMREELGVVVEVGGELLATRFVYPDRIVELHFHRCVLGGEPTPMLGQRMRWVSRSELGALRFPPADRELVALLARGSSRQ